MSNNDHPPLWPFYVFPLVGIVIGGLLGLIPGVWLTVRCAAGAAAPTCPFTAAQLTWVRPVALVGVLAITIGLALAGYALAQRMYGSDQAPLEGQDAIDEMLRRAQEE